MHNQIDVNNVVYVHLKICFFFRRKKNTHENWCEFKLILRWFWNGRTHKTKSNKPSMNLNLMKNNLLIFNYSLVSSTFLQFEGWVWRENAYFMFTIESLKKFRMESIYFICKKFCSIIRPMCAIKSILNFGPLRIWKKNI